MPGKQRNSRRSRLCGGVFAPILLLAPVPVVAQTSGPNAPIHRIDDDRRLCLSQLGESPLPADFEFIGLTASEEVGPDPAITMWSRSALLVETLSSDAVTQTVARIPLTNVAPLSAALVGWDDGTPIVELFDARNGTIWTVDGTAGELIDTDAPAGSVAASGTIRNKSGWVWLEKTIDPAADTSRIRIFARGQAGPADRRGAVVLPDEPRRGIDRLLHVRSDGYGGYLVKEAGFPFGTIAFTQDGEEVWRTYPDLEDLRDRLGETDLHYVMATPVVALNDATLNTYVALRTRRRASALTLHRGKDVRYGLIPSDLSFLAVLPQRQLLIGIQGNTSRSLVFLKWRWIDQRHSCT